MAPQQCLGIHYSATHITAVVASAQPGAAESLDPIKVPVETGASTDPDAAALEELTLQLRRRHAKLPPAALALAGEFYQSQFHHSEFTDPRQMAQTLPFDVEEEFMLDAEATAICYQRLPGTGPGSELVVHVAQRDHLKQLFPEFDRAGVDALIAQPDLAAWLTYTKHYAQLPSGQSAVLLAWAAGTFYLMILDSAHHPVLARSCHCNSDDHARATITCELQRSLALLPADQPPQAIYYHSAGFTNDQLHAISEATNLTCTPLPTDDPAVAFAAGASLAWLKHDTEADFRADRLPPRSLITAKRKSLFALSAAVSLLLLTCVIVFKARQASHLDIERRAEKAIIAAWKDTNPDQSVPRQQRLMPGRLSKQLRELKSRTSTRAEQTQPTSVGHIMMLLFDRLDSLPEKFGLTIKKISLSVKDGQATLVGAVPSAADMDRLITVFKHENSPLRYVNWDYDLSAGSSAKTGSGNRVAFSMPLRIRSQSPKPDRTAQ